MNHRFILLAFLCIQIVFGQSFGKNKVQYRDFDWKFIKSPHFDVYYYANEFELAEFTANAAEEAYEQISIHLRWTLKKPVSVIVYNSHNDFQQTNVVDTYMSEGIGGVTELFKNRVVLPFDGSYKEFRHVIHHELVHAVINDMIYGGNIQGIISGRIRLNIPLWTNEGLAEYLSSNWDTKADMIIRDMAIHDEIPQVKRLESYMAYKGGQSVWRFISEKYGREKVGEIFTKMKKYQNAEKGYEKALGFDFEELSKQWKKYLKKEYWPDVAGRDELEDISKQLTDHKEKGNFYNISPALSPDGSKIAILSDREGYADIYLIDALNGKIIRRLVKGNRSIDFEELKWLQPGISWAPDSKKIVIASKAGKGDVFHLIDVASGKSEKISLELDGLFTASWSPDGKQLAFIGNKGRASDIYLYDFSTKILVNLTDDIFSDSEPVWSPDGKKIAFISDRDDYLHVDSDNTTGETLEVDMFTHDFSQDDIYVIDVKTKEIIRVTNTDYNENYPVWMHKRNALFFTADYNGVWNIFYRDLDSGTQIPVSNVLTGIQQLSLSNDDQLLVFAGYSKGGWDIYSLTNPGRLSKKKIPLTNYIQNKDQDESLADLRWNKNKQMKSSRGADDYSQYIFARQYDQYNNTILNQKEEKKSAFHDSLRQEDTYLPQLYKTHFTLDMIGGSMMISNVFGAQGMTYFSWSDLMGDHKIFFGTEMVLTLENSDYFLSYAYLKNRTDLYFNFSQTANFFSLGYQRFGRLRHIGIGSFLSRPFNRFNRIDVGLSYHLFKYEVFLDEFLTGEYALYSEDKLSTVLPMVSWIYDNSVFGYTGPLDGFRQNISVTATPGIGTGKIKFQTVIWDIRKYIRIWKYYAFAGRLMIGKSMGHDPQKFFLGGAHNWYFGRGETDGNDDSGQFREVILDDENNNLLKDIYFSEYAMPVRGARYAERMGTNVALANFEFRFPFIFAFGPPTRVAATYLFGHAFLDIGAAWDEYEEFSDQQKLQDKYGYMTSVTSPKVAGFGIGFKLFTPLGLLRVDTAWDIKPDGSYSRPQYLFSFGPDW